MVHQNGAQTALELVRQKKAILLDCDGVLWRATDMIPGAAQFVNSLAGNKKVFYVTNSSDATPENLLRKLSRGGIAADGNNVISAPYITAQRLKARGITTVFVLGSPKMIPHFAAEGITAHLADPDLPIEELKNAAIQGVQAVVCGNTQLINYTTLAQTLQYLLDPEVAFIATNRDSIYPAAGGLLLPGANTVVSALEGCSGRTPEVMGKPEPFIFDVLAAQHGLTPDDCLMVGDRLQTDILLAVRAGAASCLVLSGVTGADEWETLAEKESAPPTAVVESIADLIGWDRN